MAWQRARSANAQLAEDGWGDLGGDPPNLNDLAAHALHCWQWCGGWRPDLWPMYGAFYDVPDWEALSLAMQPLR